MKELSVCPGRLKEGYTTYSPRCIREVFGGSRVGHILPYDSGQDNEETTEKFIANRRRISISGVQEKLSFRISGKQAVLTESTEQGTHILKPIPRDLLKVNEVPANEHLTMQIAGQVFGIETAENAMIFFRNGTPAYITRRFDVKSEDRKIGVEDFASLAGRSIDQGGSNFKYDYSYERMGSLIRKFIPAWRIEIEKFYRLVVFNYLFSNGDAHLKNFSIIETRQGDYRLSPAYDLVNTRIHVEDTSFALSKGLFKDDYEYRAMKSKHNPGLDGFQEFGR